MTKMSPLRAAKGPRKLVEVESLGVMMASHLIVKFPPPPCFHCTWKAWHKAPQPDSSFECSSGHGALLHPGRFDRTEEAPNEQYCLGGHGRPTIFDAPGGGLSAGREAFR